MNTKLITNLSLFGVLFGVMTSFGFIGQQFEWIGWMLFLVIAAILISKKQATQKFLNGAVAGFIFAVLFYVVQTLLLSTYLQNHPEYESQIKELAKDISPASFMIFSGMLLSTLYAAAVGLSVVGWYKFGKNEQKR